MKKILILLFTVCLLLNGCSYSENIDSQAFVIAVGIDEGKAYPLRLTFVFANPTASGEEQTPSAPKKDIVTIEAPTVFSAVRKMDAIKSKTINLTHTKIVVFSDEIAKKGIKEYLSGFAQSRDFRPNTYVAVAMGKAEKYLDCVQPAQEAFIEKYYDHMMQKVAANKVNEAYLYYLFFNTANSFSGSLVPLVGVNENTLPKSSQPHYTDSDDFSYEARAGEIIRKASNESEVLGCAVFKNDKMAGTLGSFQTDLSRIICNEYYPHSYSITYPDKNNYVTLRLIQQQEPSFHTKIKNNIPEINVSVPVSIEYVDAGKIGNSKENSEKFCRFLENELDFEAKKLLNDAQNKYESDFLGLGDFFKKHFKDINSWEKFNWEKKYTSCNINISFKVVFADFEETN